MPLRLTIAAQDLPPAWKKGDIVSVVPEGGTWGNKEVPPNFIRVNVTNGTTADIESWVKQWKKTYSYTLDQDLPTHYVITIRVDPAVIDASQTNATLAADIADYLLAKTGYTIAVVSQTTTSLQITVQKPADLQALANDVIDRFETTVAASLLYVPSATVNSIIANDPVTGYYERNRGQMNSFLANKLSN